MKKLVFFTLFAAFANYNIAAFGENDIRQTFAIEAHHYSTSNSHIEKNPISDNFASIRFFKNKFNLEAGANIFTRISSDESTVLTRGMIDFINDAGFLHVNHAGTFKITYGISTKKGQQVNILVDGTPVSGSKLSCAKNRQMTTQSIIVKVNETISLQTIDSVDLIQESKDDVTAFLEVIQIGWQ